MNKLRIEPIVGTLDSEVEVPGSKSITNRALVIAAMATGTSVLTGVGEGDDVEAMIACLGSLGVTTKRSESAIEIHGVAGSLNRPGRPLDANMSGTTARFVSPLLYLCGGTMTAHPQMQARPMSSISNALRELGAEVDADHLPFRVEPPVDVRVDAERPTLEIGADVSSQFISGLLMLGPLLPHGLELVLVGTPVSRSYTAMTITVMESFGATVHLTERGFIIAGGGYVSRSYAIEPDASAATYPLAAAAIVGGRVRVKGLGSGSMQGDATFTQVIADMGARVRVTSEFTEVRGSGELRPVEVDLGDRSDTAPTFAALAARAQGRSAATGIGFIRTTKESDRVAGAVTELNRLGLSAGIDDDGFHVVGGPHLHAEVETYEDHRMAMAFGLLGLVDQPVTVQDPLCVEKTFPRYWEMLDQLRCEARSIPLVLAIDGPAGAGKSTVTRAVADALHVPFLDTGAMYRAIAHGALSNDVSLDDHDAITEVAEAATISLLDGAVLLNHVDVTKTIRTPEVTAAVSAVAAIPGVRRELVQRQRLWAQQRGAGVIEGRDIATAVFPDATLKIFLTATAEQRARRRSAETGQADMQAMISDIERRDQFDSTRAMDPLRKATDALEIDSSELTVTEVVDLIIDQWQEATQ